MRKTKATKRKKTEKTKVQRGGEREKRKVQYMWNDHRCCYTI